MAHSSVNLSESIEDFLAREQLLAGELDPGEFARQIVRHPGRLAAGPEEPALRHEFSGPLFRRGAWSPLRRAWLCLQVGFIAAATAAGLHFSDASAGFMIPAGIVAISSLSLCLLLLARSSAVHEIKILARERRRFRDDGDAYAHYFTTLTESLAAAATERSISHHSGAPLIRNLLASAQESMAAVGHRDVALLVLRHEPDRSLLTYSALPSDSAISPSPGCRQLDSSILDSCRRNSASSHSVEFDFSDRRQELIALSNRPFRDCDRLVLNHVAACLALIAATTLARK